MINNKPFANAGFRLLAFFTQACALSLSHALFWFYIISPSRSLPEFMKNLFFYLLVFLLPWYFIHTLIMSYLTARFGGNLGKLLTGLEIVQKNGSYLSFKEALFRSTIGYTFSTLFFCLGYLNIITDVEKRAWHDKAIGSYVVRKNNMWILSIFILLVTFFLNIFLVFSSISRMVNSPLKTDVITVFQESKKHESSKEANRGITKKFTVSSRFDQLQKEIYSYMDKKEYNVALEKAQSLTQISKTDFEKAESRKVIGEIYKEQKQEERARTYFLKTIQYAPNYAEGYSLLAEVSIILYRDSEALIYAKKAVELEPNVALYRNDLGVALDNLGQTEEAVEQVKKAIELNPNVQIYKDNLLKMESRLPGRKT